MVIPLALGVQYMSTLLMVFIIKAPNELTVYTPYNVLCNLNTNERQLIMEAFKLTDMKCYVVPHDELIYKRLNVVSVFQFNKKINAVENCMVSNDLKTYDCIHQDIFNLWFLHYTYLVELNKDSLNLLNNNEYSKVVIE